MKVAQYEVLGRLFFRRRPSRRDDRWSLVLLKPPPDQGAECFDRPVRDGYSLETLTQHFVLGYFHRVPPGRVFSAYSQTLSCRAWAAAGPGPFLNATKAPLLHVRRYTSRAPIGGDLPLCFPTTSLPPRNAVAGECTLSRLCPVRLPNPALRTGLLSLSPSLLRPPGYGGQAGTNIQRIP
jgi:hypothetical protein